MMICGACFQHQNKGFTMKDIICGTILSLIFAITLSGCYEATPAFAVHRGIELCKPNGGVKQFLSSQPMVKVDCINGARFTIDVKRNELIP